MLSDRLATALPQHLYWLIGTLNHHYQRCAERQMAKGDMFDRKKHGEERLRKKSNWEHHQTGCRPAAQWCSLVKPYMPIGMKGAK